MSAYLTNQTFEDYQRERDELLGANAAAIRSLAAHIRLLWKRLYLRCGNDAKIKEEQEMFETLENLY